MLLSLTAKRIVLQQQPRLRPLLSSVRFFETCHKQDAASKTSKKPGYKAFADVETGAVIDLFHHHAKIHPRTNERYLDREGVTSLLEGIGERPTHTMVENIMVAADLDANGFISLGEFLHCADDLLGGAPARIVLVVGGPGSGKGVLCKRLEQECNVVHLSSGDLLREEVERDTVLGREVASIMERGELVSSAVIVKLIRRRMRHHPGKRVLLDGFPRSLQNAHDLVDLCGRPELALHLMCDDTILMERILKRRDGRTDDNFETALHRLRTFHKSHKPTMDWLREQHVPVVNLDCSGSRENVWEQLLAIGRLMRPVTNLAGQTKPRLFDDYAIVEQQQQEDEEEGEEELEEEDVPKSGTL
uniref:EF-hand domain-containing protein n=1 Tax=Cyclophora tenuis TaxID=216820 RepID=A0A7S1D364_CYCTE|mmetsp:Transcript_20774/g.35400  ORF Transcript_20774/g.35400 Transcript_20774/m.35400 type:complete len:360 (+) Transcript_20774:94-1173(+)